MDHIETLLEQMKSQINNLRDTPTLQNVGRVEEVGDGIVLASGLTKVMYGELIEIVTQENNTIPGLALNLEEGSVGIIIFGDDQSISEGDEVRTTGKIFSVPVGEELVGRVVNPLGMAIDGKGDIQATLSSPVEKVAPGVITRKAVNVPLETGVKSIDAMLSIGRGQRELIIGDRVTGKTSLALDIIINQGRVASQHHEKPVICIYCAIGQKTSKITQTVTILEKYHAMPYTIVVAASASDPVTYQYLAPYAACTMGEYFRDNGFDALIIYDDLTKHAWAYRQISLLLRRPSGREAYPGDIFYLHSRLLERAARLNEQYKGGSLTALPIIETQAGEISAYIPTNLISITDGQIFLESDLFYAGTKPAVNIGISVSRVGSAAQTKAMKRVAGRLKLEMAQFKDLAAFAQFGSDLDPATKKLLDRGARLTEILKQKLHDTMPLEEQVVIIFAGVNGFMDALPLDRCSAYEQDLLVALRTQHPEIFQEIREKKEISDALAEKLQTIVQTFTQSYTA